MMQIVAPAGAKNAEMRANVTSPGDAPPADQDELTFLVVDARTPYTTDFDGADAGKAAHSMLR